MNPRNLLGLCVLAAFGGAIVSGVLLAPPHTASASGNDPADAYDGSYGAPPATIACHVEISNSNVQGSNICSPHAHASYVEHHETHTSGSPGGSDGSGSSHDSTTSSHNTTYSEYCEADGLVTVQACDVVEDTLNDNEVLNDALDDNEIVKDNELVAEAEALTADVVATVDSTVASLLG